MTKRDAVILAHRGESEGARTYEELDSPIQVSRLVLLPLCAEKLAPQRIIPPLRLSVHKSKLSVLVVPALEEKLLPVCKPGWTGEHPCARCVMERWREVMGGDPVWYGGPTLARLRVDEDEFPTAGRGEEAHGATGAGSATGSV